MNNQQIVFPEINREEMEKGVLPKEQTIAFVEKAIDSLILIGMLKVTGIALTAGSSAMKHSRNLGVAMIRRLPSRNASSRTVSWAASGLTKIVFADLYAGNERRRMAASRLPTKFGILL